MKDIGSIFPLYEKSYDILENRIETKKRYTNVFLYSLCSEAMYDIAFNYKCEIKKVLIPAYTCRVVYGAFEQCGWESYYYGITRSMRIDINSLINVFEDIKPSVLVVHPYYGIDLNKDEISALKYIKEKGCLIVVDLTQNVFSEQRLPFVDFYVGSLRKWLPMPDGAFLENKSKDINISIENYSDNDDFYIQQRDAMFLRGKYFESNNEILKRISIRLNKAAEGIEKITPHKMSLFSKNILFNSSIEEIKQSRILNYKVLCNGIVDGPKVERVNKDIRNLSTAPLYFPIYAEERDRLQHDLAREHVYCPILWHYINGKVLVSEDVKYIYNKILVVPVDQRYGISDMEKIVNIINNWN